MDALRSQVAKMFRHGTEQERATALRALQDDAAALTQKKASEADVTQQWKGSLLTYLTAQGCGRSRMLEPCRARDWQGNGVIAGACRA